MAESQEMARKVHLLKMVPSAWFFGFSCSCISPQAPCSLTGSSLILPRWGGITYLMCDLENPPPPLSFRGHQLPCPPPRQGPRLCLLSIARGWWASLTSPVSWSIQAAITKHHRLGDLWTREIFLSQFWRLEVLDQVTHIVRFYVWWDLASQLINICLWL